MPSHHEEVCAIEHGVVLVYTDPEMVLLGFPPDVVAISFRMGYIIRQGNELWVKAELKRCGIKVVGSWKSRRSLR